MFAQGQLIFRPADGEILLLSLLDLRDLPGRGGLSPTTPQNKQFQRQKGKGLHFNYPG